MSNVVNIVEMSPRDGLQNEANQVATEDKVRLINMLSDCGFIKIETTSFVSPKWVPQMADAADVLSQIERKPGTTYCALTPNLRGLENAIAAGADEVAVFASASEGFSQHNINCSIAESIERFGPLMSAARAANMPVRGYVSCVTDCPYDGPTPPQAVADVSDSLMQLGCFEISLGDTIGAGSPDTVSKMLDAVLEKLAANVLAGHFHDTKHMALENVSVCLEAGLRTFDASAGGLGGCPYAPGAKGNVATEAVVAMLADAGYDTGIDQVKLGIAADFAKTLRTA